MQLAAHWRLVPSRLLLGASLLAAACGASSPRAGHGTSTPSSRPPSPEQAHKKQLGQRFVDAEAWAKRFEGPRRDGWQKPNHVVRLLELSEGMTVADIGAGTGYFMPHLSPVVGASGKVLCLDIEESMVDYMQRRADEQGYANVEVRMVAGDDPGLAAESVDRILIVDTWHHIPERKAYSARLAAALAPGGAVYVVDFELDDPYGPPRDHRVSPQRVVEELEAGGLTAEISNTEELDHQYVIIGRRPPP
jgi:SAM-dependent methyltransferase